MQYLILTQPDKKPSRFVLSDSPITIGRSRDNMIIISDSKISRFHACLELQNDKWILSDLKTMNGTYMNKTRLDRVTLVHSDSFTIGFTTFTFYDENAAIEPTLKFDEEKTPPLDAAQETETSEPDALNSVKIPTNPFAGANRATVHMTVVSNEIQSKPHLNKKALHLNQILILQLSGSLTDITVKKISETLQYYLDSKSHRIVIDASKLVHISSSGWESLVEASNRFKEHKGIFKIAALQPSNIKMYKTMSLNSVIPHYPSLDAALLSFGN
jgi:anti-anti-sigma factor